jgi:hypothetical protein
MRLRADFFNKDGSFRESTTLDCELELEQYSNPHAVELAARLAITDERFTDATVVVAKTDHPLSYPILFTV